MENLFDGLAQAAERLWQAGFMAGFGLGLTIGFLFGLRKRQ